MSFLRLQISLVAIIWVSGALGSWGNFRQNYTNNALKEIKIRDFSIDYDRKPWSFQTDGLVWGTPVNSENKIFVGSASKKFFALDENTGKKIWDYQIFDLADSLIDSAAAVTDSMTVVPGGDGYLHALDKNTGQLKWTFKAHHQSDEGHREGLIVNSFEGNVTVGPNGNFYAGSDNGYMYCVDKNGAEVWSFKTDMMIWSSPAFLKEQKLMVFGSLDHHLYVLDYEQGSLVQKINLKSEIKGSPTIIGNSLYIGTSGGVFNKFYIRKKAISLSWSYRVPGEIYSSPLVIGDKVMFGSLNGIFYALDIKTGKPVWTYDTFSAISSSPVGTKDGVVIFGAKNGKLYSLDSYSGERLWSFATSKLKYKVNLDSSPILTDAGAIVVGSYNGNIYRVPFEYCRNHPGDKSCDFGGRADIPTYIAALADGDHFLYLKRNGEYVSIDGLQIGRASMIKMKFVSKRNGKYLKTKSISPIGLKLWINGRRYKDYRVSADGKFLNLIVPSIGWGEGIKHLKLRYGAYERRNWFQNRINIFFTKKILKNYVIKVTRSRRSGERGNRFNEFYEKLMNGEINLGVSNLFLYQPSSLETYIPAAMDGQQFLIRLFQLDSKDIEIGYKTGAIAVPASFSNGKFIPINEKARTFHLDVNLVDYDFIMTNPFFLSAMGGGINFSRSLFQFNFDKKMGSFFASASCLKIKGNGESYTFPIEVIDNTCDHRLRVSAFGRMKVTAELSSINNEKGRVRVFNKKVRISLSKKYDSDKLISIVYLHKNQIKRKTSVLKKGEKRAVFLFDKKAPEVFKVFVNVKHLEE